MSCEYDTKRYALTRVRQTQIFLSALSFPYGLASILVTHGIAETALQLTLLLSSGLFATGTLFYHRLSKQSKAKHQHPIAEVVADVLFTVLFIVLWIVVLILWAKRRTPWGNRVVEQVPQMYAHFLTFMLGATHFVAFVKATAHHYRSIRARLFGSRVTFVQCPSCSRTAHVEASEGLTGNATSANWRRSNRDKLAEDTEDPVFDFYTDEPSSSANPNINLAGDEQEQGVLLRPSEEDARPVDLEGSGDA
ncbi:hypothetical protein BGW36DRAFT_422671 [Talaromyces proteolyticus]|uniref:Uncharacterized protein n=1 Tax=Talaromyces proteolyticus TaxID=1131652 RepID=A0AAD4Q1Y3_9EURO|nr:uncharacterized protein BGW36DRAFT_422671 [Talaromyces proteolyticus]KAH8703097.1 hypothetical protein BGW36DRAFT_422671 [Talaromyces proteolyticus]